MISVVIVNHNYGRFLVEAIESVLSQSEFLEDLTVVDNGSTDDSLDILSRYSGKLNVIEQANLGQGASMNLAPVCAKGDLVWFLDADDFLLPRSLEGASKGWKPEFSMMSGPVNPVKEDGSPLERSLRETRHADAGNVLPLLLKHGHYFWTPCSANVFSKEFLKQCLPMPAEDYVIAGDAYLFINAPFHGEVGRIDEPVAAYRIHSKNYGMRQEGTFNEKRYRNKVRISMNLEKELHKRAAQYGHAYKKNRSLTRFNTIWARAMLWKLSKGDPLMPGESGFQIFKTALAAVATQRKVSLMGRLSRLTATSGLLLAPKFLLRRLQKND